MQISPTILILDGGATRLAQRVARAVRSLGFFSLIAPANQPLDPRQNPAPAALILVKGSAPLAAELMNRIDLVIEDERFPADLPRCESEPEIFWGPADLGPDFLHGLAAFFQARALPRTFTPQAVLPLLLTEIQALAGDRKVLLALSGGVDSSVCAVLIHRALGGRLCSIFVDHGLLRTGEAGEVAALASGRRDFNLSMIDAQERFLQALAGVTDPEEKRKIIGRVFIEVFEDEARRRDDVAFLGQGTIYPDIIESRPPVTGGAPVKSHHNVGGLPERLNLALLEPLKYFFKDEVRILGLELGLPPEAVFRQPFPGPGLGVRCVGEVTAEKLNLLRTADLIMRREIEEAGLARRPWQYFAIILPVRSVGVRRHARSMGYACVLRAIDTTDAMTARPTALPFELLTKIADRILAEAPGFSRALFDLSAKPPATIEWE